MPFVLQVTPTPHPMQFILWLMDFDRSLSWAQLLGIPSFPLHLVLFLVLGFFSCSSLIAFCLRVLTVLQVKCAFSV